MQDNAKQNSDSTLTKKTNLHPVHLEIKNGIEHLGFITIMAPAAEIYSFWRDLHNLPKFMKNLTSLEVKDATNSHWKWKALKGATQVEWDSEIVEDSPGRLIAWRSSEASTVAHTGEVHFKELPHNRGTEVRVTLNYHPPGGVVTDFVSKVLGESPQALLKGDLYKLRELIEVGVAATIEGQPRGGDDETLNPHLHDLH